MIACPAQAGARGCAGRLERRCDPVRAVRQLIGRRMGIIELHEACPPRNPGGIERVWESNAPPDVTFPGGARNRVGERLPGSYSVFPSDRQSFTRRVSLLRDALSSSTSSHRPASTSQQCVPLIAQDGKYSKRKARTGVFQIGDKGKRQRRVAISEPRASGSGNHLTTKHTEVSPKFPACSVVKKSRPLAHARGSNNHRCADGGHPRRGDAWRQAHQA